jgi:hypothetical protein
MINNIMTYTLKRGFNFISALVNFKKEKLDTNILKSKEYFKFLFSKIENEIKIINSSSELLKCLYLLDVLKKSDNLLKEIYIISRIKDLKILGNYLLFILKKSETGEVKFDNLLENLNLDKEFIIKELLKQFKIENPPEKKPEKKESEIKDEEKDEKVTEEIKRILAKSRFKVEEIDNELVTEEFIESNIKEDNDLIVRGNYLELLQPENELDEESVFSLPTNKIEPEKEEDVDFLEGDVFSLPDVKKEKEIVNEQINTEELEEIKLDEPVEETSGKIEESIVEEATDSFENEKIEVSRNLLTGEEPAEKIQQEEEMISEKIVFDESTQEINTNDAVYLEEKETEEIIREKPEETIEEAEIIEVENSVYMQYETELMERSAVLLSGFEELRNLVKETDSFEERKENIIKEITENSAYLEEYSRKMSFEVITGIYNIINITFNLYGKTVGEEILNLFTNSINLVESLIKGEDFNGFDSVMKALEILKQTLLESKKEEIKEEKTVQEKEEEEIPSTTKQYDTSERQKLAQIKQNILDIENVFISLEEIKGKYQAYEALRRLSHTFAHFKELVSTANALEMRKLAQLAEASYIFIKFVQNYRMDPFENEISEVFKYIIYNFKLIFLDKPTKDIDLLISYLNDPVKIFEKKEKINT